MQAHPSILIHGGTVIDPSRKLNKICNVFISEGRVQSCDDQRPAADRRIDAAGLLVTPGLIDGHVHLREPGGEHKETIATGTAAAVAGGFTAVACMPNTDPPLDDAARVADLRQRIAGSARCRVHPVACLTRGRQGAELVDFKALGDAGAVAFSDDGDGVADGALMARAFAALAAVDGLAIQHCEDPTVDRGVMHKGAVATRLGLPGLSPLAEELMIARDLAMAEVHQARYHVAHISTRRAVALVRAAKTQGVAVSTEVCPHHLLLTDEACSTLDPDYKMHPPLRTAADVRACVTGVADGTIDMLVTDHAPHTAAEKARGFLEAPPGIVGLETALPLFARALIEPGIIRWEQLIDLMSTRPARILGVPGGSLRPGAVADVTLIDPRAEWSINADTFRSKGRNSPFDGERVTGRAVCTIVDGTIRFSTLQHPGEP